MTFHRQNCSFLYHISENSPRNLKKELTELLTSYFSDFKFNIVFINNSTIIGKKNPYKDRLPLRMRSSIVHKWCCPRDCGSGYV